MTRDAHPRTGGDGARLVHLVRDSSGEPAGALVLLHGRGADEHDLVPVLDVLDPERRLAGLTPRAPLPGPGGGRWWYRVPRVGFPDSATFHASYAQLTIFLDDWLAERGIDWEHTIVGGFSMGCVMSYAVGFGRGAAAWPSSTTSTAAAISSIRGRCGPCARGSGRLSRGSSRRLRRWRPNGRPTSTC